MSRPSEPVGIVSTSATLTFLPRRMIEPLPKARSICASAASSALVLSTNAPSTTRRFGWLTARLLLSRSALGKQLRRVPGDPLVTHYVHGLFSCASSFFVLSQDNSAD